MRRLAGQTFAWEVNKLSWILKSIGMVVFVMGWVTFFAAPRNGALNNTDQGKSEFAGEVVAKPQSIVDVVAPLWGKMYLEDGVYPGARVKKGQNLVRIVLELDALERLPLVDRNIEVNQFLEVAAQKVRFALDDYRRAMRIGSKNADFQKEVERRKQIYENAINEYQMMTQQKTRQENVMRSRDPRTQRVTAPLAGFVDEIFFVPGQVNLTGEFRKLLTVVDLSSVWVRAEIFEKDMATFRNAREAVITTDAFPGETFRGKFQAFGSEIDPRTRTIPVYYEAPNRGEKLRIGLRVRIRPLLRSTG
ncbi:MAG: efflux RND transporter periplasmic adaptor subunit [Acidobacteria bacterium]|nr:efflux RND transporter periplasmic adaptor subunit [Acidobacteriota bacterium]